ncbi:MAG: hypothetical protein QOF06_286 [Solirubrobacterales bacterium]|jgi:hypothetical protein|nr:hypothetical protein [Solirubrobacterales bacterium]
MSGGRLLIACLVTLVGLAATPVAEATYDPLSSGATVLKFDKGFRGLLRDHGVRLATREGASFKSGALRFPVSGGRFDPTTKKGTVEHSGTALFVRAGRSLSLKKVQLKTTRPSSPLVAKLGGGQLKLGPAQRLVVTRPGFADEVTVSKLRLSGKFATRLSKRLGLRGVFREGMLVGSAVTRANPETVTVLGEGRARFELDPGMAAKLDDLHVAVNPIFPAERPGVFTLPIFGGKLAPDLSAGFVQLHGGLELLQLGGGQVIWSESLVDLVGRALSPEVEVKPSPPYVGKAGLLAIAALDLGAGSTAANPGPRTLAVDSAGLNMSESTAATFNEVFAKPQGKQGVFAAGEPLGRLSFLAETQ